MFTAFFPFFVVIALIALRSPAAWVGTVAFCALLQSPSPISLYAGGRLVGIQPAYALVPIGLLHLVLLNIRSAKDGGRNGDGYVIKAPILVLVLFALYGAMHAIITPRLLDGAVLVMAPRAGLDFAFPEPLKPGGGNYIQAFYLAMSITLVVLLDYFIVKEKVNHRAAIGGLLAGVGLVIALALYQLVAFYAGLPWPSSVVNSNLGVAQLWGQTAYGFPRLSATFLEPSMFALHMLPFFAYALFNRYYGVALCLGALLFISTSATAYAGLALIGGYWLLSEAISGRPLKLYVSSIVLVVLAACALPIILHFDFDRVILTMTVEKFDSASGRARMTADSHALSVFADTFGFGVGLGSNRASSVIPTLLSTIGWLGIVLLVAAVSLTVKNSLASGMQESRRILPAIFSFFVAWSLTAPDLAIPLIWILLGLCIGYASSSIKPRDMTVPGHRLVGDTNPSDSWAGRGLPI